MRLGLLSLNQLNLLLQEKEGRQQRATPSPGAEWTTFWRPDEFHWRTNQQTEDVRQLSHSKISFYGTMLISGGSDWLMHW
jgi:hypothetical protein